jgi:hypothetical protein
VASAAGTRHQIDVEVSSVLKTKDGPEYEIIREVTNLETGELLDASAAEIFQVAAFSQGEIIEISRRKPQQLVQLDSFVDLSETHAGVAVCVHDIEEAVQTLLESRAARPKAAQVKERISGLREEIASIEKALAAEVFTRFKEYESAGEAVATTEGTWDEIASAIVEAIDSVERIELSATGEGISAEYVDAVRSGQEKATALLRKELRRLLAGVKRVIRRSRVLLKPWRAAQSAVADEYQTFVAGTGTAATFTSRRKTLKGKLSQAASELTVTQGLVNEWDAAWKSATAEASEIDRLLKERFAIRSGKAGELTARSDGMLRISVTEKTDRSVSLGVLKGAQSGLHKTTLEALSDDVPAHHLVLQLLNPDYAVSTSIEAAQLAKLREHVLSLDSSAAFLRRLVRALPDDTPLIEYRKAKGQYGPIEGISQGQRCTALIGLTLLGGSQPVVMDQPEDSLDIRAVWDDVATAVRRGKSRRQFIFTTHNSTIAVAADSDCITILEPAGLGAAKTHEGAIDMDDIKKSAIQHLEGGSKAYALRRQKYNIAGDER